MSSKWRISIRMLCIIGLAFFICFGIPIFRNEATMLAVAAPKSKAKGQEKKEDDKKKKEIEEAQKKAREEYKKALGEISKGKWKDALKHLQAAIKKDPQPSENYYPYFTLGLVSIQLRDFEKALQYCGQAQAKGVAPKANLNECLKTAETLANEEKKTAGQKKAREEYKKAQGDIDKGKWKEALTHLQKAVKEDAQPSENYYPYLTLGLAYAQLGDIEKAQQYCGQSQTTGVAPKAALSECLKVIEVLVQPEPTPVPQPTVTPMLPPVPETPEPTIAEQQPEPKLPVSQPDTPPVITVVSDIPEETEEPTLTFAGMVADDHGIDAFRVQLRKPDTKSIVEQPRIQMVQEMFETTVPLEIGQNGILITAVDTAGQTTIQEFIVTRNRPVSSEPASSRAASSENPDTIQTPEQRQGTVYAVIIGIGKFQDERIPSLRFTANDAQGLYDVLIDPNYGGVPEDHVQLLLDEEATYQTIKSAIGTWLSENARENDTVIIYYSGHGAPEKEETYWVTYNANIDDLYSTALSNNEIYDMLKRVESKRMLTFLDSCYSAATVNRKDRTRDIMVEIPWDKFSGEGNVTISASDGSQLSLEVEAYEHGVFTYYLLKGMKGGADGMAGTERDGMIEVEELWSYVRTTVTDAARKRGNKQTPVLQGALTAGIPVTYDLAYLEELERQRQQEKQEKQAKLQDLFEQGQIKADHFNCAFQMIEAGQSDGYLDGLLSEEISPEVFTRLFKCEE